MQKKLNSEKKMNTMLNKQSKGGRKKLSSKKKKIVERQRKTLETLRFNDKPMKPRDKLT